MKKKKSFWSLGETWLMDDSYKMYYHKQTIANTINDLAEVEAVESDVTGLTLAIYFDRTKPDSVNIVHWALIIYPF